MGEAAIRKKNGTYPTGHKTSPYGNTSDDATVSGFFDSLEVNKTVMNELSSHITDVLADFEFEPGVIVVEIEGPDFKFDDGFNPDGIRTLSDGRRVFVNPNAGTEEFILQHTTSDVLEVVKLYVREGNAALLLFSGKRYGLLPLMKMRASRTLN